MEQQFDGGGFACAVGAEKAKDFAWGDGEGEVMECQIFFASATEGLIEPVDGNGCGHGVLSQLRKWVGGNATAQTEGAARAVASGEGLYSTVPVPSWWLASRHQPRQC